MTDAEHKRRKTGRPRYDESTPSEAQVFRRVAESITIDRTQDAPMWRQLADGLESAITKGRIAPHSRIPPEGALAEIFGVSITVVRTALKELNGLGLVVSRHRRGNFVSSRVHASDFLSQKVSFYEQLKANGRDVRFEVLQKGHRLATETEVDRLDLEHKSKQVFSFDRLFLLDDAPIFHARAVYPAALLPGIAEHDLGARAMTRILDEEYGVRSHSAEREISAANPGPEVARHLDVTESTPVSKVETVFFLPDGTPMEVSISYFNTNLVPIRISIR